MSDDKMREEFEAALAKLFSDTLGEQITAQQIAECRESETDYSLEGASLAWWAWQASRAALVVELPTVDGASLTATACRIITKKCRAAIIAAGVRVKP